MLASQRFLPIALSLLLAACGGDDDRTSGAFASVGDELDTSAGDSTSGESSGESSSDASSSDSSGSTSGETSSTDEASSSDSTDTGPEALPEWLLSIDEIDLTTDRLIQVGVGSKLGSNAVICDDITLPPGVPDDTNITSLTFNADTIYASARTLVNGDTLITIDPCTCTAATVGMYGFTSVSGITSNELQDMFGVATGEDVLITIDPQSAMSTVVQMLGTDWGSTGLTWSSPEDGILFGIDATSDRLYTFDASDGAQLGAVQLGADFGSVGLEFHPDLNTLFACGLAGQARSLFSVNPGSGAVAPLAADVWQTDCDNIAAPFGSVECIPDPQ